VLALLVLVGVAFWVPGEQGRAALAASLRAPALLVVHRHARPPCQNVKPAIGLPAQQFACASQAAFGFTCPASVCDYRCLAPHPREKQNEPPSTTMFCCWLCQAS
jgi:hypothetical protein